MQEIVLVNTVFTSSKFKDIKAGGFNYGLLKVPERTPLNIFIGYVQIKNKPGAISWSLRDKACINKTLMEDFPTNATVWNVHLLHYGNQTWSNIKLKSTLSY